MAADPDGPSLGREPRKAVAGARMMLVSSDAPQGCSPFTLSVKDLPGGSWGVNDAAPLRAPYGLQSFPLARSAQAGPS